MSPGQAITPASILYGVRRPDMVEANLGGGQGLAKFVAEAHKLGMKVLVDNVPNGLEPSWQYAWFAVCDL